MDVTVTHDDLFLLVGKKEAQISVLCTQLAAAGTRIAQLEKALAAQFAEQTVTGIGPGGAIPLKESDDAH